MHISSAVCTVCAIIMACISISTYHMKAQWVQLPQSIPNLGGNHPTACSGKPMSTQQKAEPLRCLTLRTRGTTSDLLQRFVDHHSINAESYMYQCGWGTTTYLLCRFGGHHHTLERSSARAPWHSSLHKSKPHTQAIKTITRHWPQSLHCRSA